MITLGNVHQGVLSHVRGNYDGGVVTVGDWLSRRRWWRWWRRRWHVWRWGRGRGWDGEVASSSGFVDDTLIDIARSTRVVDLVAVNLVAI